MSWGRERLHYMTQAVAQGSHLSLGAHWIQAPFLWQSPQCVSGPQTLIHKILVTVFPSLPSTGPICSHWDFSGAVHPLPCLSQPQGLLGWTRPMRFTAIARSGPARWISPPVLEISKDGAGESCRDRDQSPHLLIQLQHQAIQN